MRKLLFAQAAALAVTLAGPAVAADLPLKSEAPYVPRFTWTGCYLGGSLGGGFATKDITDPVALVQESFAPGSTTGITTANLSPRGARDRRPDRLRLSVRSLLVVGIEGFAAGSTMKGSRIVGLPAGNPDTALVRGQDRFPDKRDRAARLCVRPRAGLRQGRRRHGGGPIRCLGVIHRPSVRLYRSGKSLWLDRGRRRGMGVHAALVRQSRIQLLWVRDQNDRDVRSGQSFLGNVDVKQNIQVVKVGFNFHIWGPGL